MSDIGLLVRPGDGGKAYRLDSNRAQTLSLIRAISIDLHGDFKKQGYQQSHHIPEARDFNIVLIPTKTVMVGQDGNMSVIVDIFGMLPGINPRDFTVTRLSHIRMNNGVHSSNCAGMKETSSIWYSLTLVRMRCGLSGILVAITGQIIPSGQRVTPPLMVVVTSKKPPRLSKSTRQANSAPMTNPKGQPSPHSASVTIRSWACGL
ncbi:hypothetical protein AB0856_001130 [Xenorhabdus stockiae]